MGRLLLLLGYIITPVGALCRTASFKALAALAIVVFSASTEGFSQFTAITDGNWNDGATWGNTSPGTQGVDYPFTGQTAVLNANVTIPNGYAAVITDVTISAGYNLTIANGGSLALNGVLTVEDDGLGSNGILDIFGTLQANQGSSFVNDGNNNTTVYSTGKYTHNFTTTAGGILQAGWNTGSTCEVIGYTSNTTAPTHLDQTFHHFTWNCPNGTGSASSFISFAGVLTTINGDFTVSATGGSNRTLRLFDTFSSGTVSVGGNVLINGSGRLVFSTTGTANAVSVGGNFTISNNVASTSTFATSGSATLTVNGNFLMNPTAATTLNLASLAGGTGTFNLLGNFSINSSSTLGSNSSATAAINFNRSSGVQTFANSGTVQKINFTIASTSTVDVGTSAITGTGSFTSNGVFRVGSVDALGPLQANTTAGNLRNPVAQRTFNSGSTVTYNGASAQVIGDGHPTGAGITTRINNAAGVSLQASLVIVGTIILDNGNLSIGSNTLTMNGTFTPNSNSLVATTNSNIVIGGTGNFGTLSLSGSTTINSFTLNRTSSGSVTLGSALTIKNFGTFTQQAGNLILNGNMLTISGDFSQTGGTLTGDAGASLVIDQSGTLPANISLSGSALNTLTISRSTPTVTMSPTITLSNLNLTDGTLANSGAITMTTTTGTVTVVAGTMSGNAPAGTLYNVVYNNPGALATGSELPTSTTALNNLTKGAGGILTLSNAVTVNGTLLLNGTINSGSNAVDLKGNMVSNVNPTFTGSTVTFSGTTTLSGSAPPVFGNMVIAGTFNASVGYTVNGQLNFSSGTFNNGTVATTFNGAPSTIIGNTPTFYDVIVSGSLTAPSGTMNVSHNWTNNGTFTHNSGTVAFTGTSVIGGTQTTTFRNLTVNGSSTVTAPATLNVAGNFLNGGTWNAGATLNVAGNFTNNSTFTAGTGTVVFNGSSTQSIAGSSTTTFNNITVSNPVNSPAVQVQSNQNLRGVLTLSGTNTVFDADGSSNTSIFRLLSSSDSPTVDASIASIPSGASVSGNVTVQRYMAIEGNNSRIYRYISAPVSNAPVSQLQSFIPVTGTFTGASSCSGCGTSQSMFSYDETVTTDTNLSGTADLNDGYINFPAASNTETFSVGRGYTVFVRGNIAPVSGAGSALWELRGPVNSGNRSLPVSFSSSGTVANDGWNLVGNPYPSTIDWNSGGWTKTNINNATYVLDNGLSNPVYATYIGGVGANGGSQYIPTGQAFFVKSDGGTPVLTATEAVKVAGTQTTFFRQAAVPDMVRITLRQGNVSDESVIRFTSDATATFDAQWDAYKLTNPTGSFNLSSLTSDNKKLAINAMPPITSCVTSVRLDVSDVTVGNYSLDFGDFDAFTDVNTKLVLYDAFANKSIDVRALSSYAFQVTSDPASYGSNRFSLTVGESLKTITATDGTGCGKGSVTLTASGTSDGNYRWYDTAVGGSPIDGAVNGTFSTPVINKTTTFYVAAANSAGCTSSQRIPVVATVTVIDPVVISVDGVSLKSSYSQGNQWYVDGVAIPGATSQFYTPLKSGVYKVAASSQNCTTSAEREFVVTGLEDTALPSHITVYPNPTEGNVSVAVKSANEVTARVLSLNGSLLQEKPLEGTTVKRGSFNLEDHAAGMYIMIIQDGNQTFRTRLIKNR